MAVLDACSPDRVKEQEIKAYRFVKHEVADESFVPVGKMNPSDSHGDASPQPSPRSKIFWDTPTLKRPQFTWIWLVMKPAPKWLGLGEVNPKATL